MKRVNHKNISYLQPHKPDSKIYHAWQEPIPMVMEVSQEDGPRAQDLYRGCSTCRGQVSTNRGWDYPDEWSGIATDKVIAVALSILLFGKREHFHRQVPALNYLSYHANVFLAEIRKHNCESIQSRYGMHIT